MDNKSSRRTLGAYIIAIIVLIVLFAFLPSLMSRSTEESEQDFERYLEAGELTEVVITQNSEVPTGSVEFQLIGDSTQRVVYVTDVNDAIDKLEEYDVSYIVEDVSSTGSFETVILPIILLVFFMILIFSLIGRSMAGANNANSKMMDFGKSRATLQAPKESTVRFSDVAGLTEEKEDLQEIVDFLRNPQKYTKLGARIPKGVILTGRPGTGKTLLAKAVAGEANVPFFSISGSDFVEMFVGVGASRVRDLFDQAKKNAPCIVFIDEIDAVGRRRGTGMGGGHDEREQTLNQLLVEMDGFSVNEGIIVMAATNRVDILDPAILRPGRFDRKIAVSLPDVKAARKFSAFTREINRWVTMST